MRIDPFLTQRLVKGLLWCLTGLTLFFLIFIIAFISVKGLPQVSFNFLFHDIEDMGRAGGIFPTIVSTLYLTAIALLMASPLGVGTAIYLNGIYPGRLDDPADPFRRRMPGRRPFHHSRAFSVLCYLSLSLILAGPCSPAA